MCELCTEVSLECIYLRHLCVLTIYMLTWYAVFSNHVSAYNCVIVNSKTGGALKEYYIGLSIIVWCSHVIQTLAIVGSRKLGSTKPKAEYHKLQQYCKWLLDYLRGASVSTFVCAGNLYTGNELEKCLIALYLRFSPTWAWSLCMLWASTMILLFDMWI